MVNKYVIDKHNGEKVLGRKRYLLFYCIFGFVLDDVSLIPEFFLTKQ